VNIDGTTGFNVNLDEKNMFVNALVTLLSNDALRAEMGTAAHNHWKENYQFSHFKSRFLDIIRNNLLT